MAVISPTVVSVPAPGGSIRRTYGTSGQNSADTLTTAAVPGITSRRLCWVGVHYSAAPTFASGVITISVISTTPSVTQLVVSSGSNVQDFVWFPDNDDMELQVGDQIQVSCPAAGGTITSTITINERQT